MVCSRCQKLAKGTALATPAVKKKSEMYHGSSASKPTLGQTGVGKVLTASLAQLFKSLTYLRASYYPNRQRTLMLNTQGMSTTCYTFVLGVNALQFMFQVQIQNYAGTLTLSKMRL